MYAKTLNLIIFCHTLFSQYAKTDFLWIGRYQKFHIYNQGTINRGQNFYLFQIDCIIKPIKHFRIWSWKHNGRKSRVLSKFSNLQWMKPVKKPTSCFLYILHLRTNYLWTDQFHKTTVFKQIRDKSVKSAKQKKLVLAESPKIQW